MGTETIGSKISLINTENGIELSLDCYIYDILLIDLIFLPGFSELIESQINLEKR